MTNYTLKPLSLILLLLALSLPALAQVNTSLCQPIYEALPNNALLPNNYSPCPIIRPSEGIVRQSQSLSTKYPLYTS